MHACQAFMREWLAADADGRDVKDRGLGQGIACDASGCIGGLADGARVAYALTPDAFEDDCREAVLVVAARAPPPPGCAAMVISRDTWRARGALALHRTPEGFAIQSVRAADFDRTWSPASPQRRAGKSADEPSTAALARTPPRDATPQPEDIEADQ
jgi:competence protein ComEC